VRQAIEIRNKKKRKELYYEWRKTYGDDIARESAKIAEATMAGTFSLDKLWNMIRPSSR
jgi:hypothetical protein